MKPLFRIEPLEPEEGALPRGRIQISRFVEDFELDESWDPPTYARHWRAELARLVAGAPAVALTTWAAPSSELANRRAWVLYRAGEMVFVREHLFPAGELPVEVSAEGAILTILPRSALSEDGDRISEWRTTIQAIRDFLGTQPREGR
jgi:hypothetical protein